MADTKASAVDRRLLLAACIGGLVFLYYWLDRSGVLAIFLDSQDLQARVAALGVAGPLLIISAMSVAIVINPIPSAPIALAAGAAYGHTLGTVYVVVGAEIGALTAFALARWLGYDLLRRYLGDAIRLGWLGSQNALTWMVLVSRLMPFVSFDLVSYGAGLTPLKTWRFALATLIGLVPASFLLAHFGGELVGGDLGRSIPLVLALGLLTVLPLLVIGWMRRNRARP